MINLLEKMNIIKDTILKFVPAKYIYLFGSYAYGNPTEKSDIDIYIVTPDNINNFSELYTKIIGDLGDRKIFFVDLVLKTESVFNARILRSNFEKTIYHNGKMIHGY
jgi:predicted nucleotidyltransferase